MPSHLDSKSVLISVKVYELLLAACPAEFRREYGPAMKQLFRDQCRDAWNEKRGWGLAAWWLRALPDLAKTAFVEHLTSLRRRESLFAKIVRAIRADPMARAAFVRMFVVVFLLCMLASVLLSIWTPKRYSSMVRIEVQKEAPEARAGEAPQAIASPDPYFLATQLKIIQSYSNLTNVIGKLRLDSKLAQQNGFTRWTMDETFAYLSKKISVQQTRGTSLIEISTKNLDPALAANIANEIAASYRNARLELFRQARESNHLLGSSMRQKPLDEPTPSRPLVIVRDPARPSLHSVLKGTDFLLMGVFGGTLLAVVSCGALALFTFLRRQFSQGQMVRATRARPHFSSAFVRMFAVVLPLCLLTSALLAVWVPKRYSSTVRIEVGKDASEALTDEARQAMLRPDPYFVATQLKIIESHAILTNVIGSLRLDSKLAQQNGFTRWTMDQTFAYLSKKISVQQTRGTGLIEISTKNADPVLAADIANSIASYYREARLELWKQTHQTNVATGSLEQGLPEKPRPFNLSVIVRDPARPSRQAVLGPTDFLLMGVCGGTLLALLARGASSLFTLLRQRLTHRQGTPSSAA